MSTVVQNKTFGGDVQVSPTTYTFSAAPTAGNKVVVQVSSYPSIPTAVTVGGIAATKIVGQLAGSGSDGASIWYADMSGTPTTALVITGTWVGPDHGYFSGSATELSGAAAGAPEAISNTATGNSNAPAVTTTGAVTNGTGMLFACWSNGTSSALNTAGTPSGWTGTYANNTTEGGDGDRKALSGGSGTQSVTFSVNGGGSVLWAAAIVYVADAGGTTVSDPPWSAAQRAMRNTLLRM